MIGDAISRVLNGLNDPGLEEQARAELRMLKDAALVLRQSLLPHSRWGDAPIVEFERERSWISNAVVDGPSVQFVVIRKPGPHGSSSLVSVCPVSAELVPVLDDVARQALGEKT